MNPQQEVRAIGRDEVKDRFQDFMGSMTIINELLSERNSSKEVERIEQEMDNILYIIERAYCEMMGEGETVPCNLSDINYVITEEADRTEFTEDEIWTVFHNVQEEYPDRDARGLWMMVLERLNEEQRVERMQNGAGVTTVSDWKPK